MESKEFLGNPSGAPNRTTGLQASQKGLIGLLGVARDSQEGMDRILTDPWDKIS